VVVALGGAVLLDELALALLFVCLDEFDELPHADTPTTTEANARLARSVLNFPIVTLSSFFGQRTVLPPSAERKLSFCTISMCSGRVNLRDVETRCR
jgi:hypothetical protein